MKSSKNKHFYLATNNTANPMQPENFVKIGRHLPSALEYRSIFSFDSELKKNTHGNLIFEFYDPKDIDKAFNEAKQFIDLLNRKYKLPYECASYHIHRNGTFRIILPENLFREELPGAFLAVVYDLLLQNLTVGCSVSTLNFDLYKSGLYSVIKNWRNPDGFKISSSIFMKYPNASSLLDYVFARSWGASHIMATPGYLKNVYFEVLYIVLYQALRGDAFSNPAAFHTGLDQRTFLPELIFRCSLMNNLFYSNVLLPQSTNLIHKVCYAFGEYGQQVAYMCFELKNPTYSTLWDQDWFDKTKKSELIVPNCKKMKMSNTCTYPRPCGVSSLLELAYPEPTNKQRIPQTTQPTILASNYLYEFFKKKFNIQNILNANTLKFFTLCFLHKLTGIAIAIQGKFCVEYNATALPLTCFIALIQTNFNLQHNSFMHQWTNIIDELENILQQSYEVALPRHKLKKKDLQATVQRLRRVYNNKKKVEGTELDKLLEKRALAQTELKHITAIIKNPPSLFAKNFTPSFFAKKKKNDPKVFIFENSVKQTGFLKSLCSRSKKQAKYISVILDSFDKNNNDNPITGIFINPDLADLKIVLKNRQLQNRGLFNRFLLFQLNMYGVLSDDHIATFLNSNIYLKKLQALFRKTDDEKIVLLKLPKAISNSPQLFFDQINKIASANFMKNKQDSVNIFLLQYTFKLAALMHLYFEKDTEQNTIISPELYHVACEMIVLAINEKNFINAENDVLPVKKCKVSLKKWLSKQNKTHIHKRDIQRSFNKNYSTQVTAEAILELQKENCLIEVTPDYKTIKGPKPSSLFVLNL